MVLVFDVWHPDLSDKVRVWVRANPNPNPNPNPNSNQGALIREISEARLKPGNDVEALTSLYRRIFNFLVVRAGPEPGQEREIAAALESVFPSDRANPNSP